MSVAVDSGAVAAPLVSVIAEPHAAVADLLAELHALGFAALRVSPAAIGSITCDPTAALVVGSGASAAAQVRRTCIQLRSHSWLRHVPVVVVLPADRIPIADAVLDSHELIVRPLRPRELLSRIDRARASAPALALRSLELVVCAGALRLDPRGRRVWINERPMPFSPREFELLHYVARYPERVHSRAQLLRPASKGEEGVGVRAVDVLVRRVRAKLGVELGACLRTVRNVGYVFDERAARVLDGI